MKLRDICDSKDRLGKVYVLCHRANYLAIFLYLGNYEHRDRYKFFERVEQFVYRVIQNDCRGFNNLSVWNELDYRVDVCRITKGAHRAPVRYVTKNLECCSIK